MPNEEGADGVLRLIDEWFDTVTTPDTRVRFLVNVHYGPGSVIACQHTMKELSKSYPQDHIAYLTRGRLTSSALGL